MRDKAREKLIAQIARKSDLQLLRSWRPIKGIRDDSRYALIDPIRWTLVLADPETGYGMTLDDLEEFLARLSDS